MNYPVNGVIKWYNFFKLYKNVVGLQLNRILI